MFYVYEWFNTITGEIFYVGKGCRKRRGRISHRNKRFKEYYYSNPCDSRIIKEFEKEQEAFDYEHLRILELKAIGQARCNLDYGGKGGCHFVWTEEMRQYASEYNVMKRPEQRRRASINSPMKNPSISSKVSEANKRSLWIGDTQYKGLIDAAEEYGVTSTAVLYWIKRGYSRDNKACYYDGEQEPEFQILKHGSTKRKSVIVDGVEYKSIRQAAEAIGGSGSALSKALRKHETFKGHICEYGNQQPSGANFDNSSAKGSTTNE